MEQTDGITAAAMTARKEIGRAVAAKIRKLDAAGDLKGIAEDVLPQIEKFLESLEEKRLRRVRCGIVVTAGGLGVTILLFLLSIAGSTDAVFLPAVGLVVFFIGAGILLNGWLFTAPPKSIADNSNDAAAQIETNELALPAADPHASVTEHTTRHLKEKHLRLNSAGKKP